MNSKNYKDLFNKINLSDNISEDIKTMSFDNKTARKSFNANFATALAVLIGVLVVSNGITYAATGDTLVKKVSDGISKISGRYNSEDIDEYKVDEYVDEQGLAHHNYKINDAEMEVIVDESALGSENLDIKSNYSEDEPAYNFEISDSETEDETTTKKDK